MAKIGVGFRIPKAWYKEIQQICDRRGISTSEFLTETLAAALQKDVDASHQQPQLHNRQDALEKRLDTAEKALAALTERLTALEHKAAFSTPFARPLASNPVNWDDLPDDEPDEILTDFLEP